MPTYTYKREDGSVFEMDQKITEDSLETCPTTGQKVKRVISGGAGLVFKGSGFYLTDYVKTGGSENGAKSESSATEKSESKAAASSSDSTSSDSSSKKDTPPKSKE